MADGLISIGFWQGVLIALGLTHITIASVTIYLHRHQAHRGLDLHPVVANFFRFWLWLTTGMVTSEWVAVHRKHHARCELEEDPHSPQQVGILRVLFGGALLYRNEAKNRETIESFRHGTPDDWIERHLYDPHRFSGIGLMLLIDLLLFGFAGAAIWLVQMLWIPFWAAGVINGVGHFWGYRNFETDDASRNIVPWGILIGGEELHNNHHAYGVSARLSNKWWEFDIGWLYIRLLESVGLATVRRVAPKTSFADAVPVNLETLQAIVANRFHILSLYSRRVVKPVVRAESEGVTGMRLARLRWLKRHISREDVRRDADSVERLERSLQSNPTLHTIYEFRQRLKALWTQRVRDHVEHVQRLQSWCADAEASGIAALQEFARELRAFRSSLATA
ncbi:MAG TPA: fatty acid desaturase [Gammaproteobacteria bacterium]|nr:fatty acid desaturase [Gammaproteobacteria bacterium]